MKHPVSREGIKQGFVQIKLPARVFICDYYNQEMSVETFSGSLNTGKC